MKNMFTTTNARVLLAISALLILFILAIGCGSNPVIDQPFEYRLQVYDGLNGGKVVDQIWVPQGESTWVWVQLQSRAIIDGSTGPWGPVTSEEIMNVTIVGVPSGDNPVDLGGLPAQSRLKAGAEQQLTFWPPLGGHGGDTVVILSVPRLGDYVKTELKVTVTAPTGGTPPPPPPSSCRDLHPIREAIDGFWWDCVNGSWQNTGEPVENPSPQGEFYAYGVFGEFHSGDTLHIQKGRAETVQLFVGNSAVDLQDVTAELPASLPQWVWLPATSEISTVYTLGNPVYIPVGEYDLSLWYDGQELIIHLVVDYNPDLP